LKNAPSSFTTLEVKGKDKDQFRYKLQVYTEDCVGCAACVVECPVDALSMSPIEAERAAGEVTNQQFFEKLPEDIMGSNKEETVKGSQFKQPLMEFSGACSGCGETPYVKLLTQFFGDRMIIANATGCSSIWGGTFPSIPYTTNKDGQGPAWGNSLFEDNAEYGLGMRLAVDSNRRLLKSHVKTLLEKGFDNTELVNSFKYALENWSSTNDEMKANANKILSALPTAYNAASGEKKDILRKVVELKNYFVDKSVWAFGGDGWSYDIGFGGVDHVLASGKNINILVMDTEVYSNTGGQASKASPLGAVARFAEAGKKTNKKDLGLMMMTYGYVYVACVSMGANKNQVIKAMREAEAYDGPSIVICYAPCIAHGIDMSKAQEREKLAVDTGYWLLYRYNPDLRKEGKNPLQIDSKEPKAPVLDFIQTEKRYTSLERLAPPETIAKFREDFAKSSKERYFFYKHMSENTNF
jgi:pyruvate-ferredoxin/flavodoxin oxidoreductase